MSAMATRGLLLLALMSLATAELSTTPRSSGNYSAEALKDEIHDLPGAPPVHFRMFSGYIDVSAPDEPPGTRQMFYWFVESQSDPDTDPVLLWTNGGPGCSGLAGFLTENGPFRPTHDGRRLKINPFSWNKLANMVFIEQPMGVGFSHSTEQLPFGDASAAADNLRFILGFFARYPQYVSTDFYLSSESYGGHYLPTLAQLMEESNTVPQLRGVFLGNPLTWEKYRSYGAYGTAWGHQLLPQSLWRSYESMGCKERWNRLEFVRLVEALNSTGASEAEAHEAMEEVKAYFHCWNVTHQMDGILSDFDQYALDFPVCLSGSGLASGRHERWTLHRALKRARDPVSEEAAKAIEYQPCSMDHATVYLNQPEVQAAIGAVAGTNWSVCSSLDYNATDV